MKFWLPLLLAIAAGFLIAYVDTSKNWNDTAVTVGLVLISSFICAMVCPRMAWLWAIIIGGFVFAANVFYHNNYGSAGALLFAFLGAYAGVIFRKMMVGRTQ